MTVRQRVATSLRRIATVIFMLGFTVADAHLMNEQQGTLNFANGGAFISLLSVITSSSLVLRKMQAHNLVIKCPVYFR